MNCPNCEHEAERCHDERGCGKWVDGVVTVYANLPGDVPAYTLKASGNGDLSPTPLVANTIRREVRVGFTCPCDWPRGVKPKEESQRDRG